MAEPALPGASLQAGGGLSGKPKSIQTLESSVLTQLQNIFDSHAGAGKKWHKEQIDAFIHGVQRSTSQVPAWLAGKDELDFGSFLKYMTSPETNIMAPPPEQDLSWPLSSYFISSSHNTYLTGNQLYSDSSTDAYKNVLLRGCRCIEVDVWDGDESDVEEETTDEETEAKEKAEKRAKKKEQVSKLKSKLPGSLASKLAKTSLGKKLDKIGDDSSDSSDDEKEKAKNLGQAKVKKTPTAPIGVVEPKVLHGFTLTKEITFRDVCIAVRDCAFVTTDLPLVVSLEVHCNPEQQGAMVRIMEEVWAGLLVPQPEAEAQRLPPPGDLRGKILVKVKYAPPTDTGEEDAAADGQSDEDRLPPDAKKSAKPSKIIHALSRLGIYTRGVSFKSLSQPEATMPTHIFSLSEKGVLSVHEKQGADLFKHNKHFMMRTYPHGLRIGSSNLDPAVFWRKGIQIVALNWQECDEGMMLNEGMFAGTGGYILKPEGYRGDKDDAPSQTAVAHKTLNLKVEVFGAQHLPLPEKDDTAKGFKPYVKCEIHVEEPGEAHGDVRNDGKEKEGEYKEKTKSRKGCEPDFKGQELLFSNIPGVVEELTFVRFTVRDDEIGRDDLAAWACIRLDRLQSGYRFIHLRDKKGRDTDGVILVKITKKLD